jgi:hypothetical protein
MLFDDIIICGAGNETFQIDLPTPLTSKSKIYRIKNIGTGIITVDAYTTGGATIDGEKTIGLRQYDDLEIGSQTTDLYHIL